jgi:hypothetical protein
MTSPQSEPAADSGWVIVTPHAVYEGGPGHDGTVHPTRAAAEQAAATATAAGGDPYRGRRPPWTVEAHRPPTGLSAAAARVRFDLTYRRSPERRVFHRAGLTGPLLDDAFVAGKLSGGDWDTHDWWAAERDDGTYECDGRSDDDWHREFFVVAISEAIHEACEAFQVDGRVVVNPHSSAYSSAVHAIGEDAAQRLWEVAHRRDDPGAQVGPEPAEAVAAHAAVRRRLADVQRLLGGAGCVVERDEGYGGRPETRIVSDDADCSVFAKVIWDEGFAAFIANAPRDVAGLLATCDAQAAELADLRARLAYLEQQAAA